MEVAVHPAQPLKLELKASLEDPRLLSVSVAVANARQANRKLRSRSGFTLARLSA